MNGKLKEIDIQWDKVIDSIKIYESGFWVYEGEIRERIYTL